MTDGIHVFLRDRRDEILRTWETLVLAESRSVELVGLALRDSLPAFLDQLADWLESGEPAGSAKVAAEGLKHVIQRLDEGLDLGQVMREYRLLRESMLKVVLESEDAEQARAGSSGGHGRRARVVELARLNAGLDVALAESVEQFVAERDRRAARLEKERARAEDALHESERRIQKALALKTAGVLFFNLDGRIIDANDAFERMSGYSREALRTQVRWEDLTPPEFRAETARAAEELATVGETAPYEKQLLRPDGSRWWGLIAATRLSGGGRESECLEFIIDISDRKHAEDALRAKEQQLTAILEQLPTAVGVLDADGRVVVGNSELRRLGITRAPSKDLEQRKRWYAVDADGRSLPPDQWPGERALRGESVAPGVRFEYRDGGGESVHAVVSSVPLRDGDARQTGAIVLIQDVTRLVEAEEELRRADRQKADFLAVLSHELRNPLAPIRNSLYILERAPQGTEQATRARDVLLRQTEHLTRLVDDLLDVTRISRGKTELRRSRIDLRDVVRKTTDDVRSLFDNASIELRVDQPAGPIWVDGDATRLVQVVGNLLQNAVKFTPAGGTVAVRLGASGGEATLSVRDSGIGMEPGQEQRMFDAFAQGAQGLARAYGGLGLGLALVNGLVELHGGSVRAASEGPGRGSEFIFTLPLSGAPAPSPDTREAPPGPGRLVLIVEDNVDAGQTLAEVLQMSGHQVRVASDARSGLELARAVKPDVILCDIGLPDMDGYEFARAVRADGVPAGTRLVAISGYAQPEDRERARQAGFDAHLPKPPPLAELMDVLSNLGPRRPT